MGRQLAAVLALLALTAGCAGEAPPAQETDVQQTTEADSPTPTPTPTPTTEPSPPPPLQGIRVGIDPGHNGANAAHPEIITRQVYDGTGYKDCNTTGTSTNAGYPESRFTFAVAQRLAALVKRAGGRVTMTRTDDRGVGPCVDERAKILNRAGVDVAIDLHADGGPATGRGFAVLLPVPVGPNDAVVPESRRYGRILRDAFQQTGMPVSNYLGTDGFEPRDDLAGLNLTTVPQVLLEAGNMRNATDAALLTDPDFQRAAAQAIFQAMRRYLSR